MKITKIEKKKRLYLLEIDETDKLYVTEDTIVHFMLSKGMMLDDAQLEEIKRYAQYSYGKNLALYHLSFKQRTENEVKKYLFDHDIDPKTIYQVLENLKADNWINDAKYVETFITQNSHSGDKGPYILKQKLTQKGIASDVIDNELQKHDFNPLAEKVAQKFLKKYQNKLPQRSLKNKIIQSLTNKGFSFQESKTAFESIEVTTDEETEQELLYKELEKQYHKYSKKYDGYNLKQRLIQALARKGFGFDQINAAIRDYL